MQVKIHQTGKRDIAEIISDELIINSVQDALDLMVQEECHNSEIFILHEKNICPDFFNLRTGLAGEILQKFINYNKKLAVIGEFSKYNSNSLRAFIIECNRGRQFFFNSNAEEAIEKFSRN
ncbi:MAG: DUF4180 domain-containing protein [Syntrophothermus sp.]